MISTYPNARRNSVVLRSAVREGGFTLLELLVAITLFSMLAVMMYGGVSFGVRAWEISAQIERESGGVGAVQALLRRAVSQTTLVFYRDPRQKTQKTRVAFAGGRDKLVIVGPMSQFVGLGGRYRIGFNTVGAGRNRDLVIIWEAFRVGDPNFSFTSKAETEVLLRGIESVQISYFGREKNSTKSRWMEEWQQTQRLPSMVRVNIVFPPGDPRVWPEFFAALRTTAGRY